MKPEIAVLSNGLRIVTQAMPEVGTTSLGVWVGAGARHEREDQSGLSHLLEHMAFKGTRSRSARRIAEEIEEVGGELNAATGLESTAYYARVLEGDEGVALGLLADILLNSTFADDDLEREREVIRQEIAATRDSPDDRVFDLVHEAAWPGQAVGRPILGTDASVSHLSPNDLRGFLAANYHPGNMVVAAAGAVRHEVFCRHVEALFGGLSEGASGGVTAARYSGGARADATPFEQSHLVIAFEGPAYDSSDYFTAQVFSGLFGGGMSSRLFQEVRERRGLCYSIYSTAWGLRDTGMLAIHAATAPKNLRPLTDVVREELVRLGSTGPDAGEVLRSKAQLKAGLLMSLESSSARVEQLARHLMVHDRLITSQELMRHVDAVDHAALTAFAARLAAGRPTVGVVGAGKRSEDHAAYAERSVAA
ncbi:MAG: M16 family metallopeptidase [Hyphomicrobium sp.]